MGAREAWGPDVGHMRDRGLCGGARLVDGRDGSGGLALTGLVGPGAEP